MKIITILGARPQFIKAATVSKALMDHTQIQEVIVHTGQHFDQNMSDIFFREMNIPQPGYNLHIHSLSHGAMTGRMLEEIEKVLMQEKPDMVMVYGDTNSTLAGALAARKMHIQVAHVEAGLRSFNMKMPEEINRILTDRISNLLFCPTATAAKNLKNEGFDQFDCEVSTVGDVMEDAAILFGQISPRYATIINKLEIKGQPYVVATIHRAENTDVPENLQNIVRALNRINAEIKVVSPIHPRTKIIMEKHGLNPEFTILEPVGFMDMIELVRNSSLIMTDSGGLQKEAFFHKKFCITMREETEWTELTDLGYNLLTGSDEQKIMDAFEMMRQKHGTFEENPFGGGTASFTIAKKLEEHLMK